MWTWEPVAPVAGMHLGMAQVVFREGRLAKAAVVRQKKADQWGRVKEKVYWWADPKFAEQKVDTVQEALAKIAAHRPEPVPQAMVDALDVWTG